MERMTGIEPKTRAVGPLRRNGLPTTHTEKDTERTPHDVRTGHRHHVNPTHTPTTTVVFAGKKHADPAQARQLVFVFWATTPTIPSKRLRSLSGKTRGLFSRADHHAPDLYSEYLRERP